MSRMTIYKTVNVTNPKNVLVQIPSYIAGVKWKLQSGDMLEVSYNEDNSEVTIRPTILGRSGVDEKG